MNNENPRRLTRFHREFAPIHYTKRDAHGAGFICPLPKGWKRVIEEDYEYVRAEIEKIVKEINRQFQNLEHPFENVFMWLDTPEEKRKLAQGTELTHLQMDSERGLTAVWAGSNINSGDIYLSKDCSNTYDFNVHAMADFFDNEYAFFCHNVDNYWQAVMTRELCYRYYNLLNEWLKSHEYFEENE